MSKNKFLYYLIVIELFLFIIGGNALSVSFSGVRVRLSEVFSVILGFILVFSVKEKREKSLFYLFLWGGLSLLLIIVNFAVYDFSFSDGFAAVLYLLRFVYSVVIAYLMASYVRQAGFLFNAVKIVNIFYIAACFIGFFQYVFFPVAHEWYDLFAKIGNFWQGDPHVNRLLSTDFDPNFFSSCLLIGVAANSFLLKKRFSVNKKLFEPIKIFYYSCYAVYVAAMLLTKSRSGALGFLLFALLAVLFSVNFRRIKLRTVLCFAAAVFLFLGLLIFSDVTIFVRIRNIFVDPSAGARFTSWGKSLEVIVDTYFMGIGYNFYGAYNAKIYGAVQNNSTSGVDSSLLFTLITTGILGLVFMVLHLFSLLKKSDKFILITAFAALIISNFNNLLFYSLWIVPFYFAVYLLRRD